MRFRLLVAATVFALTSILSAYQQPLAAQDQSFNDGILMGWTIVALDTEDVFRTHVEQDDARDFDDEWLTKANSIVEIWQGLLRTSEGYSLGSDYQEDQAEFEDALGEVIDGAGTLISAAVDSDQQLVDEGNEVFLSGVGRLSDLIAKTMEPSDAAEEPEETSVVEEDVANGEVLTAGPGESITSDDWTIAIKSATYLPIFNSSMLYVISVTLEVTNNSSESRQFGRPDMSFLVTSSDGRSYDDDIFMTATGSQVTEDWSGALAPSGTYDQYVALPVMKADLVVYPDPPEGWVLTIQDETTTYEFELEFTNDPPI